MLLLHRDVLRVCKLKKPLGPSSEQLARFSIPWDCSDAKNMTEVVAGHICLKLLFLHGFFPFPEKGREFHANISKRSRRDWMLSEKTRRSALADRMNPS